MLASGTAAELYRRGGGWISLSAQPRLAWVAPAKSRTGGRPRPAQA